MSTDASAVVLILPNDDINTIVTKVRNTGSTAVQLLVPDGTTQLQSTENCETLRRSIESDNIGVVIISSDEKTLQTAIQSQFDTISVEGARVTFPETPEDVPTTPAAMQAMQAKTPDVSQQPKPAMDMGGADEFDPFSELDSLGDVLSDPQSAEDAFAAELDSLGDMGGSAQQGSDEFDAFAELDNLGDTLSDTGKPAATASQASAPPPRRRIRPEDIELSDDEKKSAASITSGGGRRATEEPRKKKSKPSKSPSLKELQEQSDKGSKDIATGGAPLPLPYLLAVILIPMVVVIAAIFWFGRTTITVTPPVIQGQEVAFNDQIIPVAQPGVEGTGIAIQAELVEAVVSATEQGQVLGEAMAPGSAAQGTVVLLNQGMNAMTLPQGTEFIGTNAQGQEVRFTSDTEVVVPPASMVQQGRQIITTLGEASVTVTARVPGSNSNIDGNSISLMALPGQQPVPVNSGVLQIEHGPISGGNEQSVRIVKEEDVYPVLQVALTSLANHARQELQTIAEQKGMQLEPSTVFPNSTTLATGEGIMQTIEPSVGQSLLDPANPSFSVTVQTNFSALATPAGRSLQQQLAEVLPGHLQNANLLQPGLTPTVTDWQWDGSRLIVDGVMQPPSKDGTVDGNTRAMILNALKGKSIEDARAELEKFKQQGLISHYVLPKKTTIPSWDFMVKLKVAPVVR